MPFKPWFEWHNNKLKAHEKVLFGHWAALEGITDNDKFIAIDGGCVWGNKLIAYCLESKTTFTVKALNSSKKLNIN